VYAAFGSVTLHDTTVNLNHAIGGAGGIGTGSKPDGATGKGIGGGLFVDATALVGLDVFTAGHARKNDASTGHNNIGGHYDTIS
jgi:hypothetical protein